MNKQWLAFAIGFLHAIPALGGFTMDENNLEDRGRRWPSGIVPYQISPEFDAYEVGRINKVISDYNSRTVLKWVARTDQKNYVQFAVINGGWAGSGIGMQLGKQMIYIRGHENPDVVAHEMGHTIGLLHEESRPDIANFLKFYGDTNIPYDQLCYELFFQKTMPNGLTRYSSYDHYSVMRRNNGCTIGNSPLVRPIGTVYTLPLNWNWDVNFLSPRDVETINALYLDPDRRFPPYAQSECTDQVTSGFCEEFKGRNGCEDYGMQITAYKSCRQTCDLCKVDHDTYTPPNGLPAPKPSVTPSPSPSPKPSPTLPPDGACGNVKEKNFCDLGSEMGFCSQSSAFSADCKRSCGGCLGIPRVTTYTNAQGQSDGPWCGGWIKYDQCDVQLVKDKCAPGCQVWTSQKSQYRKYIP